MINRTITWLLVLAVVFVPAEAFAFRFDGTCCGDPRKQDTGVLVQIGKMGISFPMNAPQTLDFDRALQSWNSIVGQALNWTTFTDPTNSFCDGYFCPVNVVAFMDRAPDLGTLAFTLNYINPFWCAWPVCDETYATTNIRFFVRDSNGTPIPWVFGDAHSAYVMPQGVSAIDAAFSFDPNPAIDEPLFFEATAIHEIGHANGLAHSTGDSRMAAAFPGGGWFHQAPVNITPFGDDQAGMRRIYPRSAHGSDLYMTSWQDIDLGLGFDNVRRSWPTTASGSANIAGTILTFPANTVMRGPAPPQIFPNSLDAKPGDTLQARICFGNMGPDGVNFGDPSFNPLEIHFSTDQHISTVDDFVSPTRPGFTGTLAAGATSCHNIQFLVPTGIPVNQWYFLGFWINRTNTEGDPSATNNIAIEQRRVFVMSP